LRGETYSPAATGPPNIFVLGVGLVAKGAGGVALRLQTPISSTGVDGRPALERLAALLAEVTSSNPFQRRRLGGLELGSLADLSDLPFTTKSELVADQQANPPFGTNLTYPLERYLHLHRTSGTSDAMLTVLDTAADWEWWGRCIATVLRAAGVGREDRIAMAYSFGPHVQFWASHEGSRAIGALAFALGGMESVRRLETIREYSATTLLCTPSYAIHLARVARENDLLDALAPVDKILCTGEPGGSLPAVRAEIEQAWGARCFDHAGLSEVGALAYPCAAAGGMHLIEDEYIAEILDPETAAPSPEGSIGELVVTSLGRIGFPSIRYRTGDLVQCSSEPCPADHRGRWLRGGILGRSDDMVAIRGMHVFPSAIEQVLRESGVVNEFRITFYSEPAATDEVKVEVELVDPAQARAIRAHLRQCLGLRIRIVPLKPGILAPQTGKARRVLDMRPLPPNRLNEQAGSR
jgi:phenylacetate-CoA ligase